VKRDRDTLSVVVVVVDYVYCIYTILHLVYPVYPGPGAYDGCLSPRWFLAVSFDIRACVRVRVYDISHACGSAFVPRAGGRGRGGKDLIPEYIITVSRALFPPFLPLSLSLSLSLSFFFLSQSMVPPPVTFVSTISSSPSPSPSLPVNIRVTFYIPRQRDAYVRWIILRRGGGTRGNTAILEYGWVDGRMGGTATHANRASNRLISLRIIVGETAARIGVAARIPTTSARSFVSYANTSPCFRAKGTKGTASTWSSAFLFSLVSCRRISELEPAGITMAADNIAAAVLGFSRINTSARPNNYTSLC